MSEKSVASPTFGILGSGMQGTSAGYDLARYAGAHSIRFGDASISQATAAAQRVNHLVSRTVCTPHEVDALNPASLSEFLNGVDVLLSCVPYWMHPKIAPVAISAGVHMVDMGGDTRVSRQTLALDHEAKRAGVTVVPDTGLAPGLVNNLAGYLVETLEEVESIRLYCGGLPQHPKPPYNYQLVFNIEGLVVEYMGEADVIQDGQAALAPTLEGLETLTIEGLGTMEAFTTSGGAGTAPETWLGRVQNYHYKTIRYPGHCALMKFFKHAGFWGEEPLATRSGFAVPRELFCTLMSPALKAPGSRDLVVVRAIGAGTRAGKRSTIQLDLLQKHDEATGFTAMEQLTGTSAAIYAAAIARGGFETGCLPYETAMTGSSFLAELQRRPIKVTINPSESDG